MVTFHEMTYARPDFDSLFAEMTAMVERIERADSAEALFAAVEDLDRVGRSLNTQFTLVNIRESIDTRDEFYAAEREVFNEAMPRFDEISTGAARAVLNSPWRAAFADRYGAHLLDKYEVRLRTFVPAIVDDLVEENKLSMEYSKLMASAEIDFEGQPRNLSAMVPFMESPDRAMRKRANDASWGWIAAHQEQLDDIFDRLVAVRHRIGTKMGFDSFIPVAYARMGRTDWDQADAVAYRRQILDHVVPLAQKMYAEQARRIGVEEMKNYDVALTFLSGNPTPKGEEDYLVDAAASMYAELSPQTDAFFGVMTSQRLMDLTTKPGKSNGGYMTFIEDYGVPFIFSNFNGTSGDVDVLTHEAGHAFQGWLQRDATLVDQREMTAEVAEIHSMSMEFFTHPWMPHFFGSDTEKYYYAHVVDALQFLPYGASIDEFQEWVYSNPTATPAERHAAYRRIERQYLPHLDYDGLAYLENGGRWQKQLHIFEYPFYYLDYTISQVCALQYFVWDLDDHEAAWSSYLTLCAETGSMPFQEVVAAAGLANPFVDGTIAALAPKLEAYLETLDQRQLV